MSIIKKMRKQKAIWWAKTGDNRFGKNTYASPVEIDCRWDDTTEQYLNDKGESQVGRAVVYVDRVLKVGDRLKRGEVDSNTEEDPYDDTYAYEIQRFDQNPNLKATETLYTAYL